MGRSNVVRFSYCLLAPALAMLLSAGCSDKGDGKPKIKKKEGIAKKIDVANRVVSMLITDKKGNQVELPGTFRDDTVVIINGRNMTIKDIKPEDKVEVHGYREGDDLSAKWIATKVVVTRPESQDWKTPGKPAGDAPSTTNSTPAPTTQPANG